MSNICFTQLVLADEPILMGLNPWPIHTVSILTIKEITFTIIDLVIMWPIGYVSKSLDLDCGLQILFTQPLVIHSSLFAFFFFQEHTMIRFKDGKPMYIAPEAHGGQVVLGNAAFNFDVLEKKDNRPIVYSANGTHGVFISLPFKRPIQPQNDSSLTKNQKKNPFPIESKDVSRGRRTELYRSSYPYL